MEEPFEYFATCPQGFERLLADELKRLGAFRVRPLKGGVAFFGGKEQGYRVCLWSRIASRITRVLARVDAHDAEALYGGAKTIHWEEYIAPGSTIAVSARGSNAALRNTQFVAVKVKDAVCDRLRVMTGARPDVALHRPDVPLWVSLHGNKATIALDYTGESLHRRGYRLSGEAVEAPLKEALAAGMLIWGGWDKVASPAVRRALQARKGEEGLPDAPAFIDPVCGSGTLVLEAAMMAADRAPGLSRDYWGFEGCADFDAELFDSILADADDRFEAGMENLPVILGADNDEKAVALARANAKRLGFGNCLQFVVADCATLEQTALQAGITTANPGFIAMNPPYGVRLLAGELDEFYKKLTQGLRSFGDAWRMVAITPDATFDSSIGYDAGEVLSVYNGAIEATLRKFRLGSTFMVDAALITLEGKEQTVALSSDHALQFAARLRKMVKARRKWAKKNNIHAYRIYDADLPDYAVAVDIFEEDGSGERCLLITEYQAPKEIDQQKAARRFRDACTVAQALLEIPDSRVFTRVRRQAKGGSQYRKKEHRSHTIIVREAGYPFELDLSGYLDTGLFLDHRITRSLVGELAGGKSFLNLFAYTGTASVYAAGGGATSTTTVDMSQTYLDWAKRNMERAGFTGREHSFIKADVLSWVKRAIAAGETFDVVFLDPPTFSNSKTMGERTWDIQRDYVQLLTDVLNMVNPGGSIVFSGNLRSFKLDEEALTKLGFAVENITAQTIPEDFSRNPKIHFCYLLKLR